MANGDMVARSRSLPPPNPFWSTRARGELVLQAVRPVDLPVPLDLEMDGEGPGEERRERGRAESRGHQTQRREMVTEVEDSGDRRIFRTPASWSSQKGGQEGIPALGLRTAGMMPEEERSEPGPTEGPMPRSSFVQDELERDLEREVVRQLHEENVKLKQKLQELEEKERSAGSGWSEVTAGEETPRPPPPPTTRRPTGESFRLDEVWEVSRWTPNGTKVPPGPPPEPVPQVPDWPFDIYETVERDEAMKWLGQPAPPVREGLFPGGRSGGRDSRWQHGECGGGVEPRLHLEECRRGMECRRAAGDATMPMTAVEARTTWLERELAMMKRVMEREASLQQRLRADYWQQPVERYDRPLSRVHGGDHEGTRAWQQPGEHEGDRAWQPGDCDGNRAAEHGGVRDGNRAVKHGGDRDGNRALEHGGDRDGNRALEHGGDRDGNRALEHGGDCDGHRATEHGGDHGGDRGEGHGEDQGRTSREQA